MGFMNDNAGGGGPPLLKWNGQEGKYVKRDGDKEFNDECFVVNPAAAVAGYIKFAGKGEQPVRTRADLPEGRGARSGLAWRHRRKSVAQGEILR